MSQVCDTQAPSANDPKPFFVTRDTTICGQSTFNLFSLLQLHVSTSTNQSTVFDDLKYGSSDGNYTDTITTDVTISSDTTFYIQNIAGACTDTNSIHITFGSPTDAGMDKDTTVCDGTVIDLKYLTTVTSGTFVDTSSSGGLNDTLFNTMGLASNTFTIFHIIYGQNTCANDTSIITINVKNDATCITNTNTINTLSFGYPCRCDNTLNVYLQGQLLLEDTLTVDGPMMQSMVFDSTGSSGFLDAVGDPIIDQAQFNEGPLGTYKLQFYRPAGIQPIVFVSLNNGPSVQIENDVFTVCEPCQAIPTLGEWGIIALTLLLFITGILFVTASASKRIDNTIN